MIHAVREGIRRSKFGWFERTFSLASMLKPAVQKGDYRPLLLDLQQILFAVISISSKVEEHASVPKIEIIDYFRAMHA